MRAQMMEEIKAQLMANQTRITEEEEERSADAWEKQVSKHTPLLCYITKNIAVLNVLYKV